MIPYVARNIRKVPHDPNHRPGFVHVYVHVALLYVYKTYYSRDSAIHTF
jgi:hypothetical protein